MLVPYSAIYANDFMRLAKAFHAESIYRDVPFSEDKVAALTNYPFCMLSFSDAKCIGCFVGSIEPYYFSDECAAQDIAFFVSKDSRGSIAAIELINAYEEWAIKQGVKHIHLSQGTAINIDKTEKFMSAIGYTKIGANVLKVV